MKTIKLKKSMLIGKRVHPVDDVVEVDDEKAKREVEKGNAEYSEAVPVVENAVLEPPKTTKQVKKVKVKKEVKKDESNN